MQVAHFLTIRLKIFYRALDEAGWGLLLVALTVSAGVLVAFLARVADTPTPEWGLALALPVFLWHFYRRDGRFLKHLHLPLRPTLWLEYGLGSLPAAALLMFSGNWTGLGLLAACVFATPFFPIPDRKTGEKLANFKLDWLPIWAFEWRAGLRQMGWSFWILWAIMLAGSWWVGTLPLFAFLWGTMTPVFYENLEPKEIALKIFSEKNGFWKKSALHVLLANAFILPHALVFLIFNAQFWYFLPAIFGYVALLTAFGLANKYASWRPGRRRATLSLLFGLFIFFTVSAIFTPVAVAWWAWKAWQAGRVWRF